jgi:hypothetical protein
MTMTSGVVADHLYVVGEDNQSSVVKVGRSGRPTARLTGIQTGNPRPTGNAPLPRRLTLFRVATSTAICRALTARHPDPRDLRP